MIVLVLEHQMFRRVNEDLEFLEETQQQEFAEMRVRWSFVI